MRPRIMGLCGVAGSGKTLVANHAEHNAGYTYAPFAAPLKSMLAASGVPRSALYGSTAEKETPLPAFGGFTGRQLMQSLGDWGRNQHPDYWVWLWAIKCAEANCVVVDDIRYQNEADAVRDRGGVVVHINRPGAVSKFAGHSSEVMDFAADVTIDNDGSIHDLLAQVDEIIGGGDNPRGEQTLHYVPHGEIVTWRRAGWVIENDLAVIHHGRHAKLMRWAGVGEPVVP